MVALFFGYVAATVYQCPLPRAASTATSAALVHALNREDYQVQEEALRGLETRTGSGNHCQIAPLEYPRQGWYEAQNLLWQDYWCRNCDVSRQLGCWCEYQTQIFCTVVCCFWRTIVSSRSSSCIFVSINGREGFTADFVQTQRRSIPSVQPDWWRDAPPLQPLHHHYGPVPQRNAVFILPIVLRGPSRRRCAPIPPLSSCSRPLPLTRPLTSLAPLISSTQDHGSMCYCHHNQVFPREKTEEQRSQQDAISYAC
jgi:hypothetical protein